MMDIECVFCQTIIPALPSNGNDETNISETASTETALTSQAAPVASPVPKLGISIAEIRGLLEPTVTSSSKDHPTKPKEPKTIDPTDVPSANPPLPSNGQNATVVDTSQQNTEATNVLPVVRMVFYNIESGTMIEKINFSFRLANQQKMFLSRQKPIN